MDVVFRNADVIDGTGADRYRADVGIMSGRIAVIDADGEDKLSGRRVVDASGLVLAPGFIDMHAHSDLALLSDPEHLAKVSQGCTLEVVGQDGLSYVPCDDSGMALLWEQLAAWNGKPDIAMDWRSVADYLDRLDRGCAVNAGYLLPHGTVRMAAMGWDDRPPTPSELDVMRGLVDTGMAEGALGMSAGLSYPPGMYADAGELAELCRVVGSHGGYFSPHQRSYGAGALEGYAEMIDIGRRGGCPVHLAHATMNFEVNRGRGAELLALIDATEDVVVTLDSYPYLPGATSLAALLPSWTMAGGPAECAIRLRDPADRARITRELDELGTDGAHGVPVDWHAIEISGVVNERNRGLVGLSVAAAAGERPASGFYLDLLLDEQFGTACIMHVGHEENVRLIMGHAGHTVGSDGLLVGDRPHPRAWGTFPRYLGHYVRELGVLSLEECVRHMTARPAGRLGLTDRGVVREGMVADLVLFDPETVADTATFARPRSLPTGIPYVVVNGRLAVDDGTRTSALAGRAVRRRSKP
ncbi:dihydroorotase [Stackebrandtia albiflava]|uniref:Dihydroorotase n=1 Tax=Stackebrandtia albiflava TaxID=406432 RepID=A0A562VEF3_9ACTN|nr:D-aminoacylase [Stackebrandtia albiflava]TWJ16197.1 dihydroorotase [Stackebrandtia albiflava]